MSHPSSGPKPGPQSGDLRPANPDAPASAQTGAQADVLAAPPSLDADHALVTLAQAGDERAYEMLVIKYQRRIERLVGRMVRDVDIVQDIAQETFIRAWRALRNFRGDAQFYTWLYRIAVNSAKKHLMDVKRDPIITEAALRGANDGDDETSFADHPLNNRSSDGDTPETAYAAKEIGEAVNAAMDALPEELRQAITLRELEGLSYEEISEMMNCPIGTVRSRIFRAREAISARIKPMLQKQTTKRW